MGKAETAINAKLTTLYKKYWPELARFRRKNKLSGPLLLRLPVLKVKLFIVGQETHGGWEGTTVEQCQNNYNEVLPLCLEEKSKLDKRYQEQRSTWKNHNPTFWKTIRKNHNSPFWRTIRTLALMLRINQKNECIAWNNLNRMDKNGSPPSPKTKEQMIKNFPLLPKEIKLCKPELVVFFTNQRYDELLKQTFKECGTQISLKKIQGLPRKKLAKITIPGFKVKAYRTYHPAYKPKKELTKILNTIVKDFKK